MNVFSSAWSKTSEEPTSTSTQSDIEKALENAASEDWDDLTKEYKQNFSSENTLKDPALALMGADNLISCDICQIKVSGCIPFVEHLKSRKHEKKAQKAYMKEKYGEKYLDMKKSLESGKVEQLSDDVPNDDDAMVFACVVCNKVCTGYITYELHLKSKAHSKKVQQEKLVQKLRGNPNANLEVEKNDLDDTMNGPLPQVFAHCQSCNKIFYNPSSYQDHLSCGSHKKKLEQENLIKKMTENGDIVKDKATEMASGPNGESEIDTDCKPFASCQTCNKKFSGPVPYQIHLTSKIHEKKLKQVGLMDKLKTLEIGTKDNGSFYCSDCNKHLSGPESYQQHMLSASHSKCVARVSMIDNLEKKYPEMVVQTIHSGDGENDGFPAEFENCVIFLCSICHMSFSGPESAQDHFVSKKHAKAMRYHELAKRQRPQIEPQNNNGIGNADETSAVDVTPKTEE